MKIKFDIKDTTLYDIADFTKDITEMVLWATLINNSEKNPEEYKYFGKSNLENKQLPFLCAPEKTKNYIAEHLENFMITNIKKGSIVIELADSQAIITFYELAKEVGLDNIIDFEIKNNININVNFDLDIEIPIVILATKRYSKILKKLLKRKK